MSHEWAKKAVEHKLYSMREVHEAEKQARAEVLAACVAYLKMAGEEALFTQHKQAYKNAAVVVATLQPAAADLEEHDRQLQIETYNGARKLWEKGLEGLLREARLDEAKLWWSKRIRDFPPQPPTWGPQRITELEKARARVEEKR